MLKLVKVNKYFNRFKSNQLHVINDVTVELPEKGLVSFLGVSGCGKTTLLNAIGGLDKINRGQIYLDGKKLSTRINSKKDRLRTLNIGYIFQDYNLLENLTVYENVEISLKMVGIKDKNEIKKRIDYVLEKVNMYRYRNKLAGSLSGGEKQRVGIARAIVKNPKIIIADEPTGNLDSRNTIEIMNIIKSISKSKLVILVTHEKDLAYFYSTRIINLEDGRIIKDEENRHENELDYRIDNKIYLKDFKHNDKLTKKKYNINIYSDEQEELNLDIVVKDGNLYIKNVDGIKLELVDDTSAIEFIDGHYKRITKSDYEKDAFDLTTLDNSKFKLKYKSIYNIGSMLAYGLKKVFNYTLMKKILLIGFFVSAMFIVYSISNIFGITDIKDKDFLEFNKNYITVMNTKNDLNKYLELGKREDILYILPGASSIKGYIKLDNIYQLNRVSLPISFSMAATDIIDSKKLVTGDMPTLENEIVIDKFLVDKMIKEDQFIMANLIDSESFIGKKVYVGELSYEIVGVVDNGNPSIYMDRNNFYETIDNSEKEGSSVNMTIIKDVDKYKTSIKLEKGVYPNNDYEVIVNYNSKDSYRLNKEMDIKINDKKLKVVGYYTSKEELNYLFVNKNTFNYKVILENRGMTMYPKDKESTIEKLHKENIAVIDGYKQSRDKHISMLEDHIKQALIIAGILLFISFVEIYLMIRASFLSRIKETGIYRAIGVKKKDIYKMFLGEILIITTFASVPGLILMSLIIRELIKIDFLENIYMMNMGVVIISLIVIYGFNILIGLLPIKLTIRKTPAQILSRNDID